MPCFFNKTTEFFGISHQAFRLVCCSFSVGTDNILGFCLGENHWCDYIEGDFTFICVIAGFNAAGLTPKYPDFISERVYALHAAARWWYEYGKEVLKRKR